MTQYANYNDITSTPEKHLNFLRELIAHVNEGLGSRGSLFEKVQKSIEVDGKPFSQSFHTNKLEHHSGNWDFEDVPDPIKIEIHQLSEAIKAADNTYDIPHFTTGYRYMIEEMTDRGVDIKTPVIKGPGGMDLSKAGSDGLETSSDGLSDLFNEQPAKKVKHTQGLEP